MSRAGRPALFHPRKVHTAPESLIAFCLIGPRPLRGKHARSQLTKMLIGEIFLHQRSSLRPFDGQESAHIFVCKWHAGLVHSLAGTPAVCLGFFAKRSV